MRKIDGLSISFEFALRWMPQDPTISWWCHQIGNISSQRALCEGNPPVTGGFPSKLQWRGALMFSLNCAWINGWANIRDASDFRHHRTHYYVIVMYQQWSTLLKVKACCHQATSHDLNKCWQSSTCMTTYKSAWWRHQMETFSALLALCAGNSPVTDVFPTQRPVTRSFDVFFELRLNKQLNKQSWGWWFEWYRAHYDVIVMAGFIPWDLKKLYC